MSLDQRPTQSAKSEHDNITFTEEDAYHVSFPHNDALVTTAMVGNLNVHKILVDNWSVADIFYFNNFAKCD